MLASSGESLVLLRSKRYKHWSRNSCMMWKWLFMKRQSIEDFMRVVGGGSQLES